VKNKILLFISSSSKKISSIFYCSCLQ